MKKVLAGIIGVLYVIFAFPQEQTEIFKPSGKVFGKIYSNFHIGLSNNNTTAFEIKRAYFGYKYFLSDRFTIKTNIDVGKPSVNIGDTLKGNTSFAQTAYLKVAAIQYKFDKLSIDFGLIGLMQFKLQENIWGHRYIYKSFMDEHKFGPSADLGLLVKYNFFENLKIDLNIRNGEGYKNLQSDNKYKSGLGATYYLQNFIIRGHYEFISESEIQSTISGFIAYELKNKFCAGLEYNMLSNYKYIVDKDLKGFSVYSSYDITDRIEIFGRYDILSSNILMNSVENWNNSKDGSALITGVQYLLVKNALVSVNLQNWNPADNLQKNVPDLFVNFEYKF